jgi:hypothetical protein
MCDLREEIKITDRDIAILCKPGEPQTEQECGTPGNFLRL